MATNYEDFELEITPLTEGRYRAQVIASPAGEASAEFRLPFSEMEIENLVLKIGRRRAGVRRIDSPEMQAAEIFGRRLFEGVFQEGVRDCLTSSLHQVDRNAIPGLRIKLRLVGVPELANLPWEYLYHPGLRRFIVVSTKTPITRYTDMARPVMPLNVDSTLRLLVVISSPTDFPELDVSREQDKIKNALLNVEHRIEVEWLEKPTLAALQQRLRKTPVHILHFIGHGGWDERAQDGVLVFEDEYKRGRHVSASQIATILRDHDSLRLVVLNACEGARSSPTDPFAGVATTLVQQGIPAVLAMQFEITDRAAIQLSQVFYESIADGYAAEAALAEARKAIYADGNDVEWGTPVLYLRAVDGNLFNLSAYLDKKPSPVVTATQSIGQSNPSDLVQPGQQAYVDTPATRAERVTAEKVASTPSTRTEDESNKVAGKSASAAPSAEEKTAYSEVKRQVAPVAEMERVVSAKSNQAAAQKALPVPQAPKTGGKTKLIIGGAVVVIALILTFLAFNGTSAGDPIAVVKAMMGAVQSKSFDSISSFACASNVSQINQSFNPSSGLSSAGADAKKWLDAMTITLSDMQYNKTSESNDKATVQVTGKMSVTYDRQKFKTLLADSLRAQGQTPTDAQVDQAVDMLFSQLEQKAQNIDSTVTVVKENGKWLVCD